MAKVSFDVGGRGSKMTATDVAEILCEAIRCAGRVYEHQDPARTHLNEYFINPRWAEGMTSTNLADWQAERGEAPDYLAAIRELMARGCAGQTTKSGRPKKPRKIREDQVLVRGIVIQCGPDAWYPGMRTWSQSQISRSTYKQRQASGQFLEAEARAWAHDMIQLCMKKFGDNLISAQLHMDEGSPHIQLQVVPVMDNGKLSNKEFFGNGYDEFLKFQQQFSDELADASAKYGIDHSEIDGEKTIEIHKFKQIQQQELLEEVEKSKEFNSKLERIQGNIVAPTQIDKVETPEVKSILGKQYIVPDDFDKYKKKVTDEAHKNVDIIYKLNSHVRQLTIENTILQDKLQTAKRENAMLNEKLQLSYKQVGELKEKFNALSLETIIERMYDVEGKANGPNNRLYEIGERKIAVGESKFFRDYSDPDFKGVGPIAFVMAMENLPFKDAIAELNNYFGSETTYKMAINDALFKKQQQKEIEELSKSRQTLPPQREDKHLHRLEYLFCKQRKVKKETVEHLVKSGQIYTDENMNCVVPRVNGGAFLRGTGIPKPGQKAWKRTIGAKHCGVAKIKGEKAKEQPTIMICEGITDAVALCELYPDREIWIMGGGLLPPLDEIKSAQTVYIALDADAAGQKMMEELQERHKSLDFQVWKPEYGKDASEHLLGLRRQAAAQEKAIKCAIDEMEAMDLGKPTLRPRLR